MLQIFLTQKGFKGHLGTQRALQEHLRHSKGTRRTIGHLGAQGTWALLHSGTWALRHSETRGTLFSRLRKLFEWMKVLNKRRVSENVTNLGDFSFEQNS